MQAPFGAFSLRCPSQAGRGKRRLRLLYLQRSLGERCVRVVVLPERLLSVLDPSGGQVAQW
jgi:hypothetical protein